MLVVANSAQSEATTAIERDWRFAELVVQTCLRPELTVRYALEPHAVLAEFGLVLSSSDPVPALPSGTEAELTIVDLSSWESMPSAGLCGGYCRISDAMAAASA